MSLQEIRKEIDAVDEEICALLAKRLELVASLKPYKKTVTDEKREAEILAKIDSPQIRGIYRSIFLHSKEFLTTNYTDS